MTDNDFEQAEQLFHEQNIDFIVEKTGYVHSLAQEYYQHYNDNFKKAINKIERILHFQEIHEIFDTIGDYHYGIEYRIFEEDKNNQKFDVQDRDTKVFVL